MDIKQKIAIDHLLGRPIAYLLNLAAYTIAAFLKRDHAFTSRPTIAVCKLVGMGSIIQASPLLRTFRVNMPEARIVFITTVSCRDLVTEMGLCDRVIVINDSSLFMLGVTSIRAVISMWFHRVDLFLNLELHSDFASILTVLSTARNRVGFFKTAYAYRNGNYTHLLYASRKAPVAQTFLQMARLAGCRTMVNGLTPLPVDSKAIGSIRDRLQTRAALDIDKGYIVVNPNASGLCIERRWPHERFAALIADLVHEFPDLVIMLIGSPNESAYVAGIHRSLPTSVQTRVADLSGHLSVKELIAVIGNTRLLITNDTGPMHIAFSLQIPSIILWGPGMPTTYGVVKNAFPVYRNVYCSPCIYEFDSPPCKGDNQCMKGILVEDVKHPAVEFLRTAAFPQIDSAVAIAYTGEDETSPLGLVGR